MSQSEMTWLNLFILVSNQGYVPLDDVQKTVGVLTTDRSYWNFWVESSERSPQCLDPGKPVSDTVVVVEAWIRKKSTYS